MKIIKWGIISTGNIAHSFAKDFVYSHGGKVHAVASRSLNKAKDFANKFNIENAYGSYDELFNDPEIDIVYIGTPHNFHFLNATEAIKKRKAVLCEKPITTNPHDCKTLIDLSVNSKTFLMEAMWMYYLPPIRKVKQWIDDGRIGNVVQLKADFGLKAMYDPSGRVFNPDLAGGALLDIGIYPIALAQLIFEQEPIDISVFSRKAKTGVDLEEIMLFQYKDDAYANLTATFACDLPNEAIISGETGYIRIPDFFKARDCLLYIDNKITEHFTDKRKSVGYNYEIDAVHSDLASGRNQSEIIPLRTSLLLQELMEKVKMKF